ncbi:PLSCR3 [Symbiodinium sp. CCMP2456]|nr:PLSCR3 [Symbiodinium sp. CCMP2456]
MDLPTGVVQGEVVGVPQMEMEWQGEVGGAPHIEMAPQQQDMTGMGMLQSLLEPHSGLIVKQTMRGCIQECLGCDAKSEYKIAPLDPGEIRGDSASDHALGVPETMYAIEESNCCCRVCNPAGRGFEMNVSQGGPGGPPVAKFNKPLTFPAICMTIQSKYGNYDCPCCCCLPMMTSHLPDGSSLQSESRYYCDVCLYVPKFKYKEDDQEVYIVHPETCCGGACIACDPCTGKGLWYIPYYFHHPATGEVLGGEYGDPYTPQVRKVWAGWKKECCSSADTFVVVFPQQATVRRKAGLLGLTFLIDFTIFEGHDSGGTYATE